MNYGENGTPKYSTADSIREALGELQHTEEMGLLADIGVDVSWENQGYYYFDKGFKLAEQFDKLTDWSDKLWLIDLAIFQLEGEEIHDVVYDSLINEDMAKRIGSKKIFVEFILKGNRQDYDLISQKFAEVLGELDWYGYRENRQAFQAVINELDLPIFVNPYPEFAAKLYEKVLGLRLHEEKQLVVESRALLTSYDDFIFGLKANQHLYEQQERMYGQRVHALQVAYDEKLCALCAFAERNGIRLESVEQACLPEISPEIETGGFRHE